MLFEVRDRDLLARIGRIKTKSGTFATPALLPVINPAIQPIPLKKIREQFNCEAIITNAYILKKHFGDEAIQKGVHKLLDYDGVIMTDSGAYQSLIYGDIEATPEEIVMYQEKIDTDIATILDVPTCWEASRAQATKTVEKTLKRAKDLSRIKTRKDIAWVGPVQGGKHLNLIAKSAKEIGRLPFEIHALGSPTPVMERYLFDLLVDMIMTAKMNLPFERPFHLFGAGHPLTFGLVVALGCDLFDSAAYALYAREDRYMTDHGTIKLGKLQFFPCSCLICTKNNPKDMKETPKTERLKLLAQHNLYICFSEIRRIKQAIVEGRLWEYLEMKALSHPSLLQALKKLKKYEDYLEKHSPVTKKSGIFFFNSVGLSRPEVVRHRKRLLKNYKPPKGAKILVLLPQMETKPFHRSKEYKRLLDKTEHLLGGKMEKIHFCVYAAPFGVVPAEIDEVYPLSQHEISLPIDAETTDYVAKQVKNYIAKTTYKKIVLLETPKMWKGKIAAACKEVCRRKKRSLCIVKTQQPWSKEPFDKVLLTFKEATSKG
jgi:7-cyano-7-deazaguanine tRNA-ribosyltransferase